MKILHIAPNAPYNNYWGYQENLLPKYQRKLGHDVTLIVTNTEHCDGKICEIACTRYDLNDGEHIIRSRINKTGIKSIDKSRAYIPVYNELLIIQPDFVFFHGLISSTIFDVIKYKKQHKDCIIVQDNHLDYNIGIRYNGIVRSYFRWKNKLSIKYVDKVYGVTPWRKKYAEDYFGIPCNKTDVLLMGADDEKINFTDKEQIRRNIRNKYFVRENDFLIVTGGKIDKNKNIDLLMEACVGRPHTKLLVFGSVSDELKDKVSSLIENDNIIYIGWINADDVYNYFLAADLVMFPGQHSVLWEQACASKVPCVFKEWEGMDHVNNGGNSDFIAHVTVDSIANKINELEYTDKYFEMKTIAESNNTDIYLYSKIAEKSLECLKN